MLFVDIKYAKLLGSRLKLFKDRGNYIWNFRCPACGDSKVSKLKARGNIYKKNNDLNVYCFNCGLSTTLGLFIKTYHPDLYKSYLFEKFIPSEKSKSLEIKQAILPKDKDVVLADIINVTVLPDNHPVMEYIRGRKLPISVYPLLYYTDTFISYVNGISDKKLEIKEHPRLVIPIFSEDGTVNGIIGRAITDNRMRYINIRIKEGIPLLYGLERVDWEKEVIVVEGALDSLHLPNSIAVNGSSFDSPILKTNKNNIVIVYDKEPRSPVLCKLIEKTIREGFNICLLPHSFPGKDITEAIQSGLSREDVLHIIHLNTSRTICKTLLEFNRWKRC